MIILHKLGRSLKGICAAIIFMASKTQKCAITHQQICKTTGVKIKDLKKAYKDYKWEVPGLRNIDMKIYVDKYARILKIDNLKNFNQLATIIEDSGLLDGR